MSNCLNPVYLAGAGFSVPCGKCFNCCVRYSKEWAVRCLDELQYNDGVGCLLTLTYAASDGNLHRKDLQDFIKRLRRRIEPQNFKYFGCGEYGGKRNRPHYHLMLFGYRPDDLIEVSRKKDRIYYKSDFLADVWNLGFVSVGDITFRSAIYCSKYLQKLDDRPHEVKPFTCMSLKPGIGYRNLKYDDILNERRYFDGKAYTLPRYYVNRAEKDGYNVDMLRMHKQQVAQAISRDIFDRNDIDSEKLLLTEKLQSKVVK